MALRVLQGVAKLLRCATCPTKACLLPQAVAARACVALLQADGLRRGSGHVLRYLRDAARRCSSQSVWVYLSIAAAAARVSTPTSML